MNAIQYEEFCRYFLSAQLGIAVSEIKSIHIPNPKRPGLLEYKHQIDLYWEDGNELVSYINIANAKWRTGSKIEQGEVLLLNQVKQKVAAHKAMMLSNIGFARGAQAVAQDEGIALHLVQPAFDTTQLAVDDRDAIQIQIQEIARRSSTPIWKHETVFKAFDDFSPHLPDDIQRKLKEASDGDRFIVMQLWRHLEYLKEIKYRIETGSYGSKGELPYYEQKIRSTSEMIEEKLSEIEASAFSSD